MNLSETYEVVRHVGWRFSPTKATYHREEVARTHSHTTDTATRFTDNRIATADAATVVACLYQLRSVGGRRLHAWRHIEQSSAAYSSILPEHRVVALLQTARHRVHWLRRVLIENVFKSDVLRFDQPSGGIWRPDLPRTVADDV